MPDPITVLAIHAFSSPGQTALSATLAGEQPEGVYDLRLKRVDYYCAVGSSDFANAVTVASGRPISAVHSSSAPGSKGFPKGAHLYYWARAWNRGGVAGPLYPAADQPGIEVFDASSAFEAARFDAEFTHTMMIPQVGDVVTNIPIGEGKEADQHSVWKIAVDDPDGGFAKNFSVRVECYDLGVITKGVCIAQNGWDGETQYDDWVAAHIGAPSALMPRFQLSGLQVSIVSPTEFRVSPGEVLAYSGRRVIKITSELIKQIDAEHVAGTNQGAQIFSTELQGTITTTGTTAAGTDTLFEAEFGAAGASELFDYSEQIGTTFNTASIINCSAGSDLIATVTDDATLSVTTESFAVTDATFRRGGYVDTGTVYQAVVGMFNFRTGDGDAGLAAFNGNGLPDMPGGYDDSRVLAVLKIVDGEIVSVHQPMLDLVGISYSSDEMTVPADGQAISITIQPDQILGRNDHVLVVAKRSFGSLYRLRVTDWDNATGVIEGVVRGRKDASGGATYDFWEVYLIPGPPSGSSPPPTAIVQQDDSTSNVTTITAPADIQVGDFLILADFAELGDGAIPAGFTSLKNNVSGTGLRQILSGKIADGTEGGTSLSGQGSGNNGVRRKVMAVFRPDVPATTFTLGDPHGEVTVTDPADQIVAASAGAGPLIVLAAYGTFDGTVDPRSMSPAKDGEVSDAGSGLYLAWKIYDSAPADVTVGMEAEAGSVGNALQSCYVSLGALAATPGDTPIFEDDGGGNAAYPEADGSQITNLSAAELTGALPALDGSQLTGVAADTADTAETVSGMLITTGSVANAAAMPIALPAGYDTHEIDVIFHPHTDGAIVWFRTDSAGGATGDSGASDYSWNFSSATHVTPTPTRSEAGDNADAQIILSGAVGNDTVEAYMGTVTCHGFNQAVYHPRITHEGMAQVADGTPRTLTGGGRRIAAAAIDFCVFLASTGNVTGSWVMRSYKAP